MSEEMQTEVLNRLDLLAAKLGVAAEHLWGVLVRQQVIEGVTDLAVMVVLLAVSSTVLVRYAKVMVRTKDDDWLGVVIPAAVVSFLTLFFLVVSFSGCISQIVNPEYGAFVELTRRLLN